MFFVVGWDDGIIRAFSPESGKPKFEILDAHHGGVTALATFSTGNVIISGGKEGHVRIWRILQGNLRDGKNTYKTELALSLQEHKAEVTSIKIDSIDQSCISSSDDGSCIIWDLQ